jgi:molybdopterin-guanine dinucleotide biosynthesis protein A
MVSTPGDADPHRPRPVHGGLLIGGASRRMGRPKALLTPGGGPSLAQRAASALSSCVDEVWLLGDGPVPAALAGLPRLADAAGVPGPLAGLLSALRSAPDALWITCPCDLPAVHPDAVAWLRAEARPDRAAVLPRAAPDAPPEPLFALFAPAALPLLESLVAGPSPAPRRLADLPGVAVVDVPPYLAGAWRDADRPEDLSAAPEVTATPRGREQRLHED